MSISILRAYFNVTVLLATPPRLLRIVMFCGLVVKLSKLAAVYPNRNK